MTTTQTFPGAAAGIDMEKATAFAARFVSDMGAAMAGLMCALGDRVGLWCHVGGSATGRRHHGNRHRGGGEPAVGLAVMERHGLARNSRAARRLPTRAHTLALAMAAHGAPRAGRAGRPSVRGVGGADQRCREVLTAAGGGLARAGRPDDGRDGRRERHGPAQRDMVGRGGAGVSVVPAICGVPAAAPVTVAGARRPAVDRAGGTRTLAAGGLPLQLGGPAAPGPLEERRILMAFWVSAARRAQSMFLARPPGGPHSWST